MIKAALACLLGKQLQGRLQPEGKPDRENITAPDWAVSSRINSHPGFKEVFFFFFSTKFSSTTRTHSSPPQTTFSLQTELPCLSYSRESISGPISPTPAYKNIISLKYVIHTPQIREKRSRQPETELRRAREKKNSEGETKVTLGSCS